MTEFTDYEEKLKHMQFYQHDRRTTMFEKYIAMKICLKLEGELAVSQTLEKYFIVRIAWVFGLNGKNFIKTMLNVGKTHDRERCQ